MRAGASPRKVAPAGAPNVRAEPSGTPDPAATLHRSTTAPEPRRPTLAAIGSRPEERPALSASLRRPWSLRAWGYRRVTKRRRMAVSRVAIACQGGGSHTAFTAGALSRLLARQRGFDVVGLSGTSGGAICALLAWNGLVARRRNPARALLAFWRDVSACEPWDRLLNEALVGALRFRGQWVSPESSPYEFPQVLLPNELPG